MSSGSELARRRRGAQPVRQPLKKKKSQSTELAQLRVVTTYRLERGLAERGVRKLIG